MAFSTTELIQITKRKGYEIDPWGNPEMISSIVDPWGNPEMISSIVDPWGSPEMISSIVDPWGSPEMKSSIVDLQQFTDTCYFIFVRKSRTHDKTGW